MHSDTKLTVGHQTDRHGRYRRKNTANYPNPVGDIPDQNSAERLEKRVETYFAYPSNPGICETILFLNIFEMCRNVAK